MTNVDALRGWIEFFLKSATGPEVLYAQQLLARTEEALTQIVVLPFDDSAANQFALLRIAKGLGQVDRTDLLITRIALAPGATIVM